MLKLLKLFQQSAFMALAITCTLNTVQAATNADDGGIELSALLGAYSSVQAKFVQSTLDAKGRRVQKSTGELVVSKPNLFRWSVDAPVAQLIISDGQKVSIYDPDLEQLSIQPLNPRLSATPALLLSGDLSSLEANFSVKKLRDEGEISNFRLSPLAADSLFESMLLSFSQGQILRMQLKDSLGSSTLIEFNELSLNAYIESARFELVVPEGTDIIDATVE